MRWRAPGGPATSSGALTPPANSRGLTTGVRQRLLVLEVETRCGSWAAIEQLTQPTGDFIADNSVRSGSLTCGLTALRGPQSRCTWAPVLALYPRLDA
jgi:hypothetical protein